MSAEQKSQAAPESRAGGSLLHSPQSGGGYELARGSGVTLPERYAGITPAEVADLLAPGAIIEEVVE